eukprot:gene19362-31496_t
MSGRADQGRSRGLNTSTQQHSSTATQQPRRRPTGRPC